MEEEQVLESERPPGLNAGAVIASAVVAGAIAFLLRRALREEGIGASARASAERAADTALRERAVATAGDFLRVHVAPEIKPMLLTVLKDVKVYVDRSFERAEDAVKSL